MTDFFYSLPIWLAGILVLALAVAVGLGSSIGVHRVLQLKPTDEEREIAINLMQVVAAYIGIMLAFSGVAVHTSPTQTLRCIRKRPVRRNYIAISRRTVPRRKQRAVISEIYVASILKDEWPALPDGRGSVVTEAALSQMFVEVGKLNPQSNRDSAIYARSHSRS